MNHKFNNETSSSLSKKKSSVAELHGIFIFALSTQNRFLQAPASPRLVYFSMNVKLANTSTHATEYTRRHKPARHGICA